LSHAAGIDKRPWLEDVYLRKQRRTVELVKSSVDALRSENKRVSLSSIQAKSKELDSEKKGVHRNTILSNEEARTYYEENCDWKKRKRHRPIKTDKIPARITEHVRIKINIDRDINRARQRYLKLSKTELVERLLLVEQAYAETEEVWLRDKDEALTWQLRAEQAESLLEENDTATATRAKVGAEDPLNRIFENANDEMPSTYPLPNQQNPPASLNKYEYFAEIEELFIRRRRKHLMLSHTDWALMEVWKEQGIPLHIVLRAINQVFDRHDAKGQRRSVKSISYCKEEVEAQFAEWLQGRVGGGSEISDNKTTDSAVVEQEEGLPFSRAAIIEHLAGCRAAFLRERDERMIGRGSELFATLSQIADRLQTLEEEFAQAPRPDASELETSLSELDTLVGYAMRAHLLSTQLAERRREADEHLRLYRDRMDPNEYEQMLDNLIFKRLREEWGIPRLSLFYL
jgi:hypothetical protein